MINIMLITNSSDITTDFVVKRLVEKGQNFYRFNTDEIGRSIDVCLDFNHSSYYLVDKTLNCTVDLSTIKSVYLRRPEISIENNSLTAAETNFIKSELYYTLEGIYRILDKAKWVNNIFNIRNAENKIYQLLLAKSIGFNIPNSLISNISSKAFAFFVGNDESCVIKPIKTGLIEAEKEEGVIFTSKVIFNSNNIDRVQACPVYLQNLVEKEGDVRVVVVGEKIFAAFIHSQDYEEATIDWRKADFPLKHSLIELPPDIEEKCQLLLSKLDLNFGALDFVLDREGNFIFLEINPNGQWAWVERQLNLKISDEIANLLVTNCLGRDS
jgi:glutathione synthase/RimK-type ligase-like ATP-grasp enzyme